MAALSVDVELGCSDEGRAQGWSLEGVKMRMQRTDGKGLLCIKIQRILRNCISLELARGLDPGLPSSDV